MHTLAEAATILGLRTPWMLRKCLKNASISPVFPPGDRRRKLLTDDDMETLRRTRNELWPTSRSEPNLTAQLSDGRSGVSARLDALERRVASLEAQLARRITPPAPATPHEPVSVPSDIPDGALQAGPFAQQIGVPETTLRRWVIAGAVETVNRPSAKPGQTERWLTVAGQQQARDRAARRGA